MEFFKKNTIFAENSKIMTPLENVKNRLIDKILLTKNEELLNAIDTIFNSTQVDNKLNLNSYQIEMLMMSETDIEQGKLISETELKEEDERWIN